MQTWNASTIMQPIYRLRWLGADLFAVLLGALALVVLIAFGEQLWLLQPLRLVLGVAYVLLLPGYCLVAALFPGRHDLGGVERAGLSIGLSIAIVPLLALALNFLPWGLGLWPALLSEAVIVALGTMLALLRRALSPEPYLPNLNWRQWCAIVAVQRRLYTVLGIGLVVAIGCAAFVFLVPPPDAQSTEFYVLGAGGLAEAYPRRTIVGEPLTVMASVSNPERVLRHYHIEVWSSDPWQNDRRTLLVRRIPIDVGPGEVRQFPVVWSMPSAGVDQQVELLLFDDSDQPYRRLRMSIDVTAR